jgi:hypothetical protein
VASPSPSPSPSALPADAVLLAIDGVPVPSTDSAMTDFEPTPSPIALASPTPKPTLFPSPTPEPVVAQPNRWPAIIVILIVAIVGSIGLFIAYKKYYQ